MKKILTLFLVAAMALSMLGISALALEESEDPAEPETTVADDSGDTAASPILHGKAKTDMQKQFRLELNAQKKELQQEKAELAQQKEALVAQYEALVAAGSTAEAEALQEQIDALKAQMNELQAQIKQTINERYMVVKTLYSDEELTQFESASELIARMYEDANVLAAGCVAVNNNLVKFDAPAYIKGGVTLVPMRAIAEQLECDVAWDGDTQTVTVTKGDTVIEITAGSTAVLVNGTPVEIDVPAGITCGRTYLPLRFLAEALNFTVTWDGDNELIDIEGGDAEDPPAETPVEAPAEAPSET
jgi:polyhydroxyalkanoate synthesis regulator phasin